MNEEVVDAVFAEKEREERHARFKTAWEEVKSQTGPYPILRQIDATRVHYQVPGISAVFEVRHLAGLQGLVALLRGMAGR
jgi:hypothetical protein